MMLFYQQYIVQLIHYLTQIMVLNDFFLGRFNRSMLHLNKVTP
jgi:hypothetical protein